MLQENCEPLDAKLLESVAHVVLMKTINVANLKDLPVRSEPLPSSRFVIHAEPRASAPERSALPAPRLLLANVRPGSREVLTIYLSEIGKVPLLDRQEEERVAGRIRQGDPQARELMIKANLRLVVKIAYDYIDLGLPLLDLISEGNIGLIKAVDRYRSDKGAKFSSYASYWIRQCMLRGLCNQGRTIRIPAYLQAKLSEMHRAEMTLEEHLGRGPSDLELAEQVHLSRREVAHLRSVTSRPVSLDAPLGEKETESLSELIQDDHASAPDDEFELKSRLQLMRRLLQRLSPRERLILYRRFGLSGKDDETLDNLGTHLGVTRERVRQIQQEAMTKLRRMFQRAEAIAAEL